jgi:Tol biopolymer transport system component
MGEVYRARDTRLDRTVAVKVLPGHLSASEEVRQRFEREAKTISQLSHPHICALYDVGNQDGVEYLVMEFLEGETLADRLVRGPLPLEQTLRYGIEIAGALDKAHRQGIVHRDLKPGNVMLTKSGVKLLDFGLAKGLVPAASPSGMTSLPTIAGTTPLTQEGTILGTFQYMAPEQLEGREADARSDIFAFGAVLYEMATGKKAFSGASQASLIGAILHLEPQPISTVQPAAPSALDRVVKTCLAKDPEERFHTAHDAGLQLKWIAQGGSEAGIPAPAVPRRSGRRSLAAGLLGFLAGAALAGIAVRAYFSPAAPAPRQASRFDLMTSTGNPVFSAPWNPLAISRDGRQVAAVLSESGGWRIFLHRFEQAGWTPVAGTEGATSPAFSPDGHWIAFQQGGKIKRVAVSGGTALVVCEGGTSYGIAWGEDDVIWFGTNAGLMRVPAAGGKAQVAVAVQAGQLSLRRPQILPGGKSMIFTALTSGTPATRIEAVSLDTGRRKTLVEGGYQPAYSPTGHLIYIPSQVGGVPIALPFDARRLEVTGPPVPAPEEAVNTFVLSESGTLAYLAAVGGQFNSLAWVDRTGKAQPLPAPTHVFEQPRLSPDGKSAAVTTREGDLDVWIYGLERGTLMRFTNDPEEDETPAWSPDGRRIAFRRNLSIFTKAADGAGAEELAATSNLNWHVGSYTPDARALVVYALGANGEDIFTLPLDPKASPTPFLQTPASEKAPTLSPDGRWIAYCSDESGRDEIYVQPYPGPGGKVQVSTDSGAEPVWARNGREIFYRKAEKMMAVDVSTQPSFSASTPRMLFEGRFTRGHRGHANYDVSPDGNHFLMIQGQESGSIPIHVVLDWSAELSRRAPAK